MTSKRRIAMAIDLEWPLAHHYQLAAGVQRYAKECGNWECTAHPFPELLIGTDGGKSPWDGIVARTTPTLAYNAARAKVPLVNVWQNSPVKGLPTVVPDSRESGRMAAAHLLEHGFSNFAYAGYKNDLARQLQLGGFRSVLAQANCDCVAESVSRKNLGSARNWIEFQEQMNRWIDRWKTPIGVFVQHDRVCRYLAEICRQRGLRIPTDVALVGCFNETAIVAHWKPTLSSIEWGYERVGYKAAELLDRLIDGAEPPTEPILVPPLALVARESTDAYCTNHPLVAKAMRFIADHYHEDLDVDAVATAVSATRRTLDRLFQQNTGISVYDTITRIRLNRVKQRLIDSNESIKTVAALCGFHDAVHLSKVFQREEGLSPSEYRTTRALRPASVEG